MEMPALDSLKIFGTDGIRGRANAFPITSDLLLRLGQSIGYLLKQRPYRKGHKHSVLIGKDTRISGYMIEQALSSGLNSMGLHVTLTGPLPTPGIGFLARNMRVDTGIIISASHNPFFDNGLKIFDTEGFKISQEVEKKLENLVFHFDFKNHLVDPEKIGRTKRVEDAIGRYVVHVKNTFPMNLNLEGLKIVLDCAHGASYKAAPFVFEELGADVIVIGNKPNGFNINQKSGALFPLRAKEVLLKHKADVGISLDGDGDRLIMVDELGQILNGDHILCLCAIHKAQNQTLAKNSIVTSHMSNLGLELALKPYGIQVFRAQVGDKNVVQKMREKGFNLGGEPSGHIIHLEHSTTGDGSVAALQVLSVMKEKKKALSQLRSFLKEVPQVLMNTRVKTKEPLHDIAGYEGLIHRCEKTLGDSGRIFVRYSGTEPLVRVLAEGDDRRVISKVAQDISLFLRDKLS